MTWKPSLIVAFEAPDVSGLCMDADNSLRCPEIEPYVVAPANVLMDFGGPEVSFKMFFPGGEDQAREVCPDSWWISVASDN